MKLPGQSLDYSLQALVQLSQQSFEGKFVPNPALKGMLWYHNYALQELDVATHSKWTKQIFSPLFWGHLSPDFPISGARLGRLVSAQGHAL